MTYPRRALDWMQPAASGPRKTTIPVLGKYKARKIAQVRAARGIPSLVPSAKVVIHLKQLREWGYSDHAIAAAAGIDQKTVWRIRNDTYETTLIGVAGRIMSVNHLPVPAQTGMKIPNHGTARRIQALQAIGWRSEDLGPMLGVDGRQIGLYNNRRWVLYETWVAIRDLYDKLSGKPGPSRYGELRARNKGWATPLQWEGIDIDHPDARPDLGATDSGGVDEVLLARIIAGHHRGPTPKAERDAFYDHVIAQGWHPARAAECLGINQEAAEKAILRRKARMREEAA